MVSFVMLYVCGLNLTSPFLLYLPISKKKKNFEMVNKVDNYNLHCLDS